MSNDPMFSAAVNYVLEQMGNARGCGYARLNNKIMCSECDVEIHC